MAEDLGKRLRGEIEEVGLDEIFNTIRLRNEDVAEPFGVPQLDRLIRAATDAKSASIRTKPAQPVIQLTSPAAGGGKTHLLYHLTALAVLPRELGGKEACAVILDTNSAFNVHRLAEQLRLLIHKATRVCTAKSTDDQPETANTIILTALKHIHIFRPQSLASTIATLQAVPAYLFNISAHYSSDRPVAFIALDSASAFYWKAKAEEEEAALLATTAVTTMSPKNTTTVSKAPVAASGYSQLTTALRATSQTFSCPLILTSWNLSPIATVSPHQGSANGRSLRPSLPAPLSSLPTLRLIVYRIPVRKLPAGISVQEAAREAADRQRAVDEGRWECVVNKWDVDERLPGRLRGGGFGFRIVGKGLLFDEDGNEDDREE